MLLALAGECEGGFYKEFLGGFPRYAFPHRPFQIPVPRPRPEPKEPIPFPPSYRCPQTKCSTDAQCRRLCGYKSTCTHCRDCNGDVVNSFCSNSQTIIACPLIECPGTGSGSCTDGKDCGGCTKGGCSGQVCHSSGEPVFTTCEYRAEYACYKTAICTRQANGQCGWIQTPELKACLAGSSFGGGLK